MIEGQPQRKTQVEISAPNLGHHLVIAWLYRQGRAEDEYNHAGNYIRDPSDLRDWESVKPRKRIAVENRLFSHAHKNERKQDQAQTAGLAQCIEHYGCLAQAFRDAAQKLHVRRVGEHDGR